MEEIRSEQQYGNRRKPQHGLDFWASLTRILGLFSFLRRRRPFRRQLVWLHVVLINPYLVFSCDTFEDPWVLEFAENSNLCLKKISCGQCIKSQITLKLLVVIRFSNFLQRKKCRDIFHERLLNDKGHVLFTHKSYHNSFPDTQFFSAIYWEIHFY